MTIRQTTYQLVSEFLARSHRKLLRGVNWLLLSILVQLQVINKHLIWTGKIDFDWFGSNTAISIVSVISRHIVAHIWQTITHVSDNLYTRDQPFDILYTNLHGLIHKFWLNAHFQQYFVPIWAGRIPKHHFWMETNTRHLPPSETT